jgi:porin
LVCALCPVATAQDARQRAPPRDAAEDVPAIESGLPSAIPEGLWVRGVAAGVYQYQELRDAGQAEDAGRGAMLLQPEFGYQITEDDRIQGSAGFAQGNGLNDQSPFLLPAWTADVQDDVDDINGRGRDHLLTAWYQRTLRPAEGHRLQLTAGLIDSTDYLDDNAYANDEFRQFLNDALVNGRAGFLPSYDVGGALRWDRGRWSARAVAMRIGENEDGQGYGFYGAQIGRTVESRLGHGTYRVVVSGTSHDFPDPEGEDDESRLGVALSADQQLGHGIGAFVRAARQDDDASIDHRDMLSAGIHLDGRRWDRPETEIGLGYAYMSDGNQDVVRSHAFEAYARIPVGEALAVTLDVQYLADDRRNGLEDVDGWIFGIRVVLEF